MDGVAYAPHLVIDVKGWGVDWYGFSVYKTWGPHMAALYGSHAAFQDLKVTPPPASSLLLLLLPPSVAPFLVFYILFFGLILFVGASSSWSTSIACR